MDMIRQTGQTISYVEPPLPLALRGFVLVLAFGVGGIIPAVFLSHVSLSTPPMHLLVVAVICLATTVFAGFMVILAFVSATELQIDPRCDSVLRVRRGPILRSSQALPRADFGAPRLEMHESEDGPFPILRLPVAGLRRPLEMACFADRAEAEVWRERIAAALAA